MFNYSFSVYWIIVLSRINMCYVSLPLSLPVIGTQSDHQSVYIQFYLYKIIGSIILIFLWSQPLLSNNHSRIQPYW